MDEHTYVVKLKFSGPIITKMYGLRLRLSQRYSHKKIHCPNHMFCVQPTNTITFERPKYETLESPIHDVIHVR